MFCRGLLLQDFGVDSFNLGDVLRGVVRFTDVTEPIVAAHVRLLTLTTCDMRHATGLTYDTTVQYISLLLARITSKVRIVLYFRCGDNVQVLSCSVLILCTHPDAEERAWRGRRMYGII